MGHDAELNEEIPIAQQLATWLHDRGIDLSRTHAHPEPHQFDAKAYRGLTVPLTITPLQVGPIYTLTRPLSSPYVAPI